MAAVDCKPNFSAAGRRRRITISVVAAIIGAVILGACVWIVAPWYVRIVVGIPTAVAFGSFLQVTRKTCVVHARHGTFEHEDMSVTPADPADVAVSRRVAATINRDAIIFGAVCSALAAATALV